MTVARTSGQAQGVLACIDKNTGKVNWEHESAYAWSSPVCVYNPDGSGKVLYCNSTGHIYLLDGKTGDVLPFIHWVYHEWLPKSEYETTTKPSYAIYEKLDLLDESGEFELSFYVSINF